MWYSIFDLGASHHYAFMYINYKKGKECNANMNMCDGIHTMWGHLLLLRNFFQCCNSKVIQCLHTYLSLSYFWKLIIFVTSCELYFSLSIWLWYELGATIGNAIQTFGAILNCKYCVNKFRWFFFIFTSYSLREFKHQRDSSKYNG